MDSVLNRQKGNFLQTDTRALWSSFSRALGNSVNKGNKPKYERVEVFSNYDRMERWVLFRPFLFRMRVAYGKSGMM